MTPEVWVHNADNSLRAVSIVRNKPGEFGCWSHCTPELLARGYSCSATPRRVCLGHDGRDGGHDHWLGKWVPQAPNMTGLSAKYYRGEFDISEAVQMVRGARGITITPVPGKDDRVDVWTL